MNEQQLRQMFSAACEWLEAAYTGSQFVSYLNRAELVGFRDGLFVVEVPGEIAIALLSRHAEMLAIQQALEALMPTGFNWSVGVEFVAGQGKQHAPEPDYLEAEVEV